MFFVVPQKMSTFGYDYDDPYEKNSFENTYLKELAEKLWQFKQILVDFYYSCLNGSIKYHFPSPDFCMEKKLVDLCIAKIEMEWADEQRKRGGITFNGILKFSEVLTWDQKLAMMERVIKLFPDWPKKLLQKDEEAKKTQKLPPPQQQPNYYDYFN